MPHSLMKVISNSCILHKLPADSGEAGSVVHREEPLPRPKDSHGIVDRGLCTPSLTTLVVLTDVTAA